MSKLMKKKILVSLVTILMVVLVVGNIYSLATEGGSNSGIQLTATNNTANKASNNTTANAAADVEDEVGATNTNTNSNSNTNTNSNSTNKTNTNSSRYNNSNSTVSGLPYAGSNTSIIFIVIALVASAAYAYKKVSDYNV